MGLSPLLSHSFATTRSPLRARFGGRRPDVDVRRVSRRLERRRSRLQRARRLLVGASRMGDRDRPRPRRVTVDGCSALRIAFVTTSTSWFGLVMSKNEFEPTGKPMLSIHGDVYRLTWPCQIEIEVERISEHRDELSGEITVRSSR